MKKKFSLINRKCAKIAFILNNSTTSEICTILNIKDPPLPPPSSVDDVLFNYFYYLIELSKLYGCNI